MPAPGVEPFALDQARGLAALANNKLAERVSASRGKQGGLATLAAADPSAVKEAERAIDRLRLSGVSIGANRRASASDRRLWPVYEFAEAARVPVYLVAAYGAVADDAPYRANGAAGMITGAAADSARHARQLIFGGVFDQFPNLQIILARLGEGAPYWYNEIEQTEVALRDATISAPRKSVREYFRSNIFLTTSDMQTSEPFQFWNAVVGRGRIIGAESATLGALFGTVS